MFVLMMAISMSRVGNNLVEPGLATSQQGLPSSGRYSPLFLRADMALSWVLPPMCSRSTFKGPVAHMSRAAHRKRAVNVMGDVLAPKDDAVRSQAARRLWQRGRDARRQSESLFQELLHAPT